MMVVPSANADVYVKVDSNGNAVGGAIVCDFNTCGVDSEFTRLTLNQGERYVLQGRGTVGIGNNNPNIKVSVDENDNWTIVKTRRNLRSDPSCNC